MMGLLLAFTFTGAASRFDTRRELIVQETNAIGTAWLRLDLLQSRAPGNASCFAATWTSGSMSIAT